MMRPGDQNGLDERRLSDDGETGEPMEDSISPEGVDRSLIRWMLSLTPTQRLEVLQGFVDGVAALRNARPA